VTEHGRKPRKPLLDKKFEKIFLKNFYDKVLISTIISFLYRKHEAQKFYCDLNHFLDREKNSKSKKNKPVETQLYNRFKFAVEVAKFSGISYKTFKM